jgi:uncharacterized membrane protein
VLTTLEWAYGGQAVAAAFLASLVEVVEAYTIVLAVGTVRGWRPAAFGAIAGLVLLLILVAVFGPLLGHVPLQVFQLGVGILLLLFGVRWLRKAILRAAGIVPLHDEDSVFAEETAYLQLEAKRAEASTHLDWLAGLATFKAVMLEGLEVVFIVIAVGSQRGLLLSASVGALAACLVVIAVGLSIHRPLSRVPENTLKFVVGLMLSAFGIYWTGEGLGVSWPGHDLAIFGFAALFLLVGFAGVSLIRRGGLEVAR